MTLPRRQPAELKNGTWGRLTLGGRHLFNISGGRIILVGFVLLLVALSALVWSSREPTQDGKPVSYWILHLDTSGSDSRAALDRLGPQDAKSGRPGALAPRLPHNLTPGPHQAVPERPDG
jgi:hypothetical protein